MQRGAFSTIFLLLFVRLNHRHSGLSNHANAEHSFFWFCLQVFCQAGPPQLVDCLLPIGNKRKMSFPGDNDVEPVKRVGNLIGRQQSFDH